jgi:hypothetical protein
VAGLGPRWAGAGEGHHPEELTLVVNHVRLYMTHYALFEEPDPVVPPAIYIDAATGAPTDELELTLPCERLGFRRARHDPTEYVATSSAPVKMLPYVVEPPSFPPLPAPPEVVAAIQGALGGAVPADVIAAGTAPFLVAIGHFEPTPKPIRARLVRRSFTVVRDLEFQVKVRVGFFFTPPPAAPVPAIGILTGWLTHGLVDTLIGVPPGADANDLVVYNWRTPMALGTHHRYVRQTATEPPPVAEAFPPGLDAVRFIGAPVADDGSYTIVGHGARVPFDAPPELALFLFGTTVLTDVELAVEESGVIISGPR